MAPRREWLLDGRCSFPSRVPSGLTGSRWRAAIADVCDVLCLLTGQEILHFFPLRKYRIINLRKVILVSVAEYQPLLNCAEFILLASLRCEGWRSSSGPRLALGRGWRLRPLCSPGPHVPWRFRLWAGAASPGAAAGTARDSPLGRWLLHSSAAVFQGGGSQEQRERWGSHGASWDLQAPSSLTSASCYGLK